MAAVTAAMSYVLGVDAGNSKTVALVADASGRVLGWGRGGGGDLYVSEQAAVTAVAAAVEGALAAAGVRVQDLEAACLSLVGADWPEDFAFWQREAEARGYGRSVTVVNDALGALRAGTVGDGTDGVVCGTGAAVGARLGNAVWHSSFWQEPVGGFELGERALRAVYRAELGLGPPTRLTEQVVRHFGGADVETVLHRLTGRETRALRQTAGLSRLLDAAALGDAAALKEVERAAAILSEYAWVAARRVGLSGEPFRLVLAGGVLRHESPLLRNAIAAKVQKKLPLAVPSLAPFEPVVGALLLALEAAALPLSDYAAFRRACPPPSFSPHEGEERKGRRWDSSVLRFFPFGDRFEAGMGAKALGAGEALVDLEVPHYQAEILLKRGLLERFPGEYYRGRPVLTAAQWEVLGLVLADLAGHYTAHFGLERRSEVAFWHNKLLDETHTFIWDDEATLPLEPLDWLGRQVQEDLVLVSADAEAAFVGGQLCFPNGWDLPDRLGRSFMTIHERTPETTMPSVHAGVRLPSAMKPGKTVWRTSWNFKLTAQLDLSTKHKAAYKADFAARAPLLSAEAAGREIFVRAERQTFTRLRRSPYVLFGIHTYNSALADEAADPKRAGQMLEVIRGTPEDVKRYKAITPLESAMTAFLRAASEPVVAYKTTGIAEGRGCNPLSAGLPAPSRLPSSRHRANTGEEFRMLWVADRGGRRGDAGGVRRTGDGLCGGLVASRQKTRTPR